VWRDDVAPSITRPKKRRKRLRGGFFFWVCSTSTRTTHSSRRPSAPQARSQRSVRGASLGFRTRLSIAPRGRITQSQRSSSPQRSVRAWGRDRPRGHRSSSGPWEITGTAEHHIEEGVHRDHHKGRTDTCRSEATSSFEPSVEGARLAQSFVSVCRAVGVARDQNQSDQGIVSWPSGPDDDDAGTLPATLAFDYDAVFGTVLNRFRWCKRGRGRMPAHGVRQRQSDTGAMLNLKDTVRCHRARGVRNPAQCGRVTAVNQWYRVPFSSTRWQRWCRRA